MNASENPCRAYRENQVLLQFKILVLIMALKLMDQEFDLLGVKLKY